MLIDVDWCCFILTDANWCWPMLTDADWCWLMLNDAWTRFHQVFFVGAYIRSFSGNVSIMNIHAITHDFYLADNQIAIQANWRYIADIQKRRVYDKCSFKKVPNVALWGVYPEVLKALIRELPLHQLVSKYVHPSKVLAALVIIDYYSLGRRLFLQHSDS